MDQQTLRQWEQRCIQEEFPWCQAACPLHVDVRAFMGRLRTGDLDGGRRILEKTLPLPEVLGSICDHPCEAFCKRREAGQALAIGSLERSCLRLGQPGPKPLILPATGKRAAVVGSGLAALTCAWDLARKGHGVTIHCPETRLGGWLRHLPPDQLAPEALERELERLLAMGVEILCDQPLAGHTPPGLDAGAIFVEHGSPWCPAQRQEVDPVTLQVAAARDLPVFAGGWPEGEGRLSPMATAADGRRAAVSMDRSLNRASLTASRDKEGPQPTRLHTSLEGVVPSPRVPSSAPGLYDAAGITAESARCLDCQCLECVKVCTYLDHHQAYPKVYARQIYNNAAIVQGVHQANRLVNGCSLCGLCTTVCPERFSMADLCLGARQDMVARDKMPPSAHAFALEDMAYNNGPRFALSRHAPGTTGSSHVFFPGCQLAAARPDHVTALYDYFRERLSGGVGLMLRCCGAPAAWSGREDLFVAATDQLLAEWHALGAPRVIVACASCLDVFRRRRPQLQACSIWEVFAEVGLPPAMGARPESNVAVHDPCSLRLEPAIRQQVRAALGMAGISFAELPHGQEDTECCGYGGLMAAADPPLARKVMARKAAASSLDYVCSCAMCRDRLARSGKRAWHVLDFFFPGSDTPESPGPGFSDRHEVRARLKTQLLRQVWQEEAPLDTSAITLDYTPEALTLLEERRILREDVASVVARAEATGRKLEDQASGRFLAYHRPRRVTYWVEYARRGDRLLVYRVWSHRMTVPGAAGEVAS